MPPFYGWGNWSMEKASNLLVTTTKHSSPGVWTQTVCQTLEPLKHEIALPVGLQLPCLQIYPVAPNLGHMRRRVHKAFGDWRLERRSMFSRCLHTTFSPRSWGLGHCDHSCLSGTAVARAEWDACFYRQDMLHSVAWVGFLWPVRATQAWHPRERSWRKQPCQYAGTCSNSRPWFFKMHICSGHMYCNRWKQKWFSIVSVLLDLTHHRNSKERVEN